MFGKIKIGLEYCFKRSGPMSMAPSQLGIFAMSDSSYEMPNLQFHVQPLSLDKFGEPLHNFPGLTASVCNLNPQSRGSVHINSNNFLSSPTIDPNYLSEEIDKKVAVQSIKLARNIINQPAMRKYEPEEYTRLTVPKVIKILRRYQVILEQQFFIRWVHVQWGHIKTL